MSQISNDSRAPQLNTQQAADGARPLDWYSATLALTAAALWGGTAVAVKYSGDMLPPVTIAAIRFALAALFMLIWCPLCGLPLRIDRSRFAIALGGGLLFFVQIVLFNFAIHWSNASHSILLISCYIPVVSVIEHFITRTDRMTRIKIVGMALSACGVVLVLFTATDQEARLPSETDRPTLIGDLLMLCSSVVLAIKLVYTKSAVRHIPPTTFIFWHHVTGTTLFAAASLVLEESYKLPFFELTRPAILGLLYQGLIVGGLCFAIQATLLSKFSATKIAVFSFACPLFGVIAAVLFRGDDMSTWFILSGTLVAFGIYLVNAANNRRSDHKDST